VSSETNPALSKLSFQWITFSSKRFDDFEKIFFGWQDSPIDLQTPGNLAERGACVGIKNKALFINVLRV
jgi:hypothetical protein